MFTDSKDGHNEAKKKWYSYGIRASEGQRFSQETVGIMSSRENSEQEISS